MDCRIPAADVDIDGPLVKALLADQCPDLADAPLGRAGEGWDNVTYRIGDDLAARLPRREGAVELLVKERRWLPDVACRLGVATPMPIREGRPSVGYPWPWNIVPWIEGETADNAPLEAGEGKHLADVLRAIHVEAPTDAPRNEFRGVPLENRSELVETRLAGLRARGRPDIEAIEAAWADGLATPRSTRRVWIQGDLHPRNVIVRGGALVGIIDWGDMAAGDPATDLAGAWTLLRSTSERRAFWNAYGADRAVVVRARAWALLFGVAMSGSGEPRHEAIGQSILDEVLGDR